MATKTAYRWNANRWYFTTRQVEEDPDFPGEYNLPSRSTWDVPPADTKTQWPRRDLDNGVWVLEDLDMDGRLAEGLITQEEYDIWKAKQEDEFVSILKERANLNADNIALVSDVQAEAQAREAADIGLESVDMELREKDVQLESGIANIQANLETLSASLAENTKTDEDTKVALQSAVAALQSSVETLQNALNYKADANHGHTVVDSANRLFNARYIGNAAFDGTGNVSLEQMGVSALVASAVANAGSGITVSRSGRETVIRDTKNKLAVKISLFKDSWTSGLGCQMERDFKEIIGGFGSCSDDSGRVRVDWDLNELMIEADHSYNYACLVMIATLR